MEPFVTRQAQRFGCGTSLALAKPVRANGVPAPTTDGQVVQDYESESSRRVLVVDDDIDAAEALGELLRDCGHEVATAHDGPQALERARLHRPEVVLLDIGLPEMDGYEVAKRIRGEVGLSDAVLVALSGYDEDRHRRLAREAGFDRHVTKPVDASKLEELLKLQL